MTNEGIVSHILPLAVEFKANAEANLEIQIYETFAFICGREYLVFDFWVCDSRFGTFRE